MTDLTNTSYGKYTNSDDKRCVHNLLKLILAENCMVSIHDGEECTVKRSTSLNDIKQGMAGTGEDIILIRNTQGELMGKFYLIYNNGSEGDPIICICDYTANDFCESIYNQLEKILEV